MSDLAAELRDLAARVADLEPGQVLGELERIRFTVWTTAVPPTAVDVPTPTRALDVEAVMAATSMSKQWLYRQARKGALPFDAAGLERWLARRPR
jgi:predicted DNA-binding transcriptional regulator AlpA